ncbi:hypothetical protein D3C86_2219400 [compost metagenome]
MVIAFPVGLYLMEKWLGNFAYKITPDWWIFPLAAGLSILIAIITVSFQSVRAALTNPVKSLRSE